MKKLSVLMITVLIISVANAQFKAGDRYLSGSFSFNTGKSDQSSPTTSKQFNIGFSPSFTNFKTERKAWGLKISANYGESKTTAGTNTQSTDQAGLGLGMFCQNYFALGKGFYFFIEKGISGGYTWSKTTESAFATNKIISTGYSATLYLKPGVGYKLTDRFIVNLDFMNLAALTYGHSKNETTVASTPTTTITNNSFGLSSGLSNASLGDIGITFGWKLK